MTSELTKCNDSCRTDRTSLFGLFDDMNNAFDRIFDTDMFFGGQRLALALSAAATRSVAVDANNERLSLTIDLPGVKPADLEVVVDGNEVTVHATRGGQARTYQYLIHNDYNAVASKASLRDGVLSLEFDRRPVTKAHRIDVTS